MDRSELDALVAASAEESYRMEFKSGLSSRGSQTDPWYSGGSLERAAKKAVLKEIGGFANSDGGTLLLGVTETNDSPPRAAGIEPIPRCQDLKARLVDLVRNAFEPAVPKIDVSVIETSGGAGVLSIDVLPSISAPIRDTLNKECYARIGETNYGMSMSQIRDMVERSMTRDSEIENSLASSARRLIHYLDQIASGDAGDCPIGIRASVVQHRPVYQYDYQQDGRAQIRWPRVGTATGRGFPNYTDVLRRRRALRGNRFSTDIGRHFIVLEISEDYTIDVFFCVVRSPNEGVIYLSWVVGALAVALEELKRIDTRYQSEFIAELELRTRSSSTQILGDSPAHSPQATESVEVFENPFILPRYGFSTPAEAQVVLTTLIHDLDSMMGREWSPLDPRELSVIQHTS